MLTAADCGKWAIINGRKLYIDLVQEDEDLATCRTRDGGEVIVVISAIRSVSI